MLRETRQFGSVRALSDFKKHDDVRMRDLQLRSQLELLQDTDVLVGLHGAGLAHIFYLDAKSVAVELKDHFWFEQRGILIYRAMARLQGVGYMSVDVRRTQQTSTGYMLNRSHTEVLARDMAALWNRTQTVPADAKCRTVRGKVSCNDRMTVL